MLDIFLTIIAKNYLRQKTEMIYLRRIVLYPCEKIKGTTTGGN